MAEVNGIGEPIEILFDVEIGMNVQSGKESGITSFVSIGAACGGGSGGSNG